MAIGQKTLKVQDNEIEVKSGVTNIMLVSEAAAEKLTKKDPKRYKIIGEVGKDGEVKKAGRGADA